MASINETDVFFIENIIPHYMENLKEVKKISIVLLKSSEKSNLLNTEDNYNYSIEETTRLKIANLHEGQFIYLNENEYINANNSSIAKHNFYYNNFYRGRLLKKQEGFNEELPINAKSKIFSYHINVGHGNCSIIVINELNNKKIWMIDCSEFDFLNHRNYSVNIDSCLEFVSQKFSINQILINKFFLTHSHYDHYSGINRLIKQGKITSNTQFYLNLHYSMPSENYNRMLRKLNKLNCNIIEPISRNSDGELEIWHPNIRTVRSQTPNYDNQIVHVEPTLNNSSTVLYFRFGEKSILFPGDIETEKWNSISQCPSHLKDSNFYIVSHHGSLNGHLRNNCPKKMTISSLANCTKSNSTQILMGRDGAYSGIYSTRVTSDFNNLVYTEKDIDSKPAKFLEIDWQTNKHTWN